MGNNQWPQNHPFPDLEPFVSRGWHSKQWNPFLNYLYNYEQNNFGIFLEPYSMYLDQEIIESQNGRPIQIAKTDHDTFVLHKNALSDILLSDKVRNRPVVVLSVLPVI